MVNKCPICGAMLNSVYLCPNCQERRASEQRNRDLQELKRKTDEQNRMIDQQNRMIEQQNREQTRIAEEQKNIAKQQLAVFEREQARVEQERNQKRFEQQAEIERKELKEEFNSRIDELNNYAIERNLMPAYVYFKSDIRVSYDYDIITKRIELIEAGVFFFDINKIIENIIKEKCLNKFWGFVKKLDSDDRIIDAERYGMCFTPESKLSLIKQIANSHSEDYVILPEPDQRLLIFPTSLAASKSLTKGYENKDIQIGEFQYKMYLRDADEAKEIAQILSDASKRIKNSHIIVDVIIDEVKKIIPECIANLPKPQEPQKPQKLPVKEHKDVCVIFMVIFGIITAFLVGYFSDSFLDEIIATIAFGFIGLIIGGKIGWSIGGMIDNRIKNKIDKKYFKYLEEEYRPIENEYNKSLNEYNKSLSEWKNNLNKTIKERIEKLSSIDVSDKFLMLDNKKDAV